MKKTGSDALWKVGGGVAGLAVVLVILVAANVIVGNVRLRADLTEEKLYTLSAGSRNVLKNLDRDVTLKLFFNSSSPEVPAFLKNYAKQVEDLLHEYGVSSRHITVETYDPKPDSDAEDWAQRYGISGQQTGMFGPPVYFGLVAAVGETEGVLPALDPRQEELLEYNITRLIYRVAHPKKPAIGVMSTLPVLGSQTPPFAMPGRRPEQQPAWAAFQDLRADYDVREVQTSAETIESNLDALILIHPKDLSDKTLYAIDQYLLRGGKLMVFVDPFSTVDIQNAQGMQMGMMPSMSSNLEKLFKAWGVEYDPEKLVADSRAVSRLRGQDNRVEESMVFLSLGPDNLNRKDVLTSPIESIMMPFAGAFKDSTGPDLKAEPLITSSASSCLVSAMAARFGGQSMRSEFKPGGVPLKLALRLTGKFKTAFPDGAPKEAAGEEKKPEGEKKADAAQAGLKEGKSTVILVGDTDMLNDPYCVQEMNFFGFKGHQPLNDNLNFFDNAVEQIAGSQDLIGIRCRGKFARPFTRVDELEQNARNEWQTQEDDLVKKLQEAQQHLNELQNQKETSQKFILSAEQKQAIAQFRKDEADTKDKLKEVRKNLRRDIESLGVKVKVINIALMPALVCLAGVLYGLRRRGMR